jgi:hypothetical protein
MNKMVEQQATEQSREIAERTAGALAKLAAEADNIFNAAHQDAGFEKRLSFVKGHYICDKTEVPMGSKFIAHCRAWTKQWIKFWDGKRVDQRTYQVRLGEKPADRNTLGDLDESKWQPGLDRKPRDPWVLQYMVPFQKLDVTEEIVIFTTSSFGGRRAVSDLCSVWGRKAAKLPDCGEPVIEISETMMPSKTFGDVRRPDFKIIGWNAGGESITEINLGTVSLQDEMQDEVPF